MLKRPKLRPRSAKPSESQGSRSRFRYRNALKEPTQNIAGKKRAGQQDVDSDYLFANFLQRPAFRSKSPFYQYRSGSGNASPHGHKRVRWKYRARAMQ